MSFVIFLILSIIKQFFQEISLFTFSIGENVVENILLKWNHFEEFWKAGTSEEDKSLMILLLSKLILINSKVSSYIDPKKLNG